MYWHVAGVCILSTAIFAGCAHSPSNQVDELKDAQADGSRAIEEQLSEADIKKAAGCRKEKPTGSRFPRWVCEPAKDDRNLLSVIGGSTEHW